MLKKWLGGILPKRKHPEPHLPVRHAIRFERLSRAAEKTLEGLHRAGFEAYIVGGAVRDMLLGVKPKDFDIATDATPEQVRATFRRSRIIGRRFQIVHVMHGSETVEVSTFRSGGGVRHDEYGRIMRDNGYGTMEQDAVRRDFTCNALYYDARRGEIIDYHHGTDDIRRAQLVMIGNAAERYQEDPVRILRAARLAGKLGFTLNQTDADAIPAAAGLLKREPVSRLFDEIMKILFSGHAEACLRQLHVSGIGTGIHPLLDALLDTERQPENHIAARTLRQTDERLRTGKTASVGFVLAALLWPQLKTLWQQNTAAGQSPAAAVNSAIAKLRDTLERGWGVPQRFSATMREIWQMQPQFAHRRGGRPFRLLAQPRFRAAYDFILLRSHTDPQAAELAEWWTHFLDADEDTRNEMVQSAPSDPATPKKKRRRRPKKKNPPPQAA